MIEYEWDVEISYTNGKKSAVGDHRFQESFAGCLKEAAEFEPDGENPEDYSFAVCPGWEFKADIVLVRTDWNAEQTNHGRSWAYLDADGTLPTHFTDAMGVDVCTVPQKFHREVAKANAAK